MNILGDSTAQARQVVKPPKPQPKKSIQPQTGTVAVLPPTHVKPVKPPPSVTTTVGKPHTTVVSSGGAPPAQGGGGGNDFGSFLNSLYPTPAPLDVNAIQQPYLDAYNKTLAQLGQAQQTENTFDSKLAGELQTLLSANGIDPGFAKSLQAALQLEALRNSGNTYAFAQGKLTDNYTGPNGLIQQALASATDAYNKALPSGSDKLAAWNAYTSAQDRRTSLGLSQTRINNQLAEWTAAHTAGGAAKTSKPPSLQWKNVGGKVAIFNPKTGKTVVTDQPYGQVKKAGGGVNLQMKNVGGKVAYFNPRTGKTTVTNMPYGSPKSGSGAGGTGGKPLSLTTLNTLVTKWHKGTGRSAIYDPKTNKPKLNPDGTPAYKVSGQVNYQAAYKLLIKRGVDDKTARQVLDTQYKKGDLGRAWLTNEEQHTLAQIAPRMSGPGAGASLTRVYKDPTGHAYLTPRQYQVLLANHQLPKGKQGHTPDGTVVWFIDPNG